MNEGKEKQCFEKINDGDVEWIGVRWALVQCELVLWRLTEVLPWGALRLTGTKTRPPQRLIHCFRLLISRKTGNIFSWAQFRPKAETATIFLSYICLLASLTKFFFCFIPFRSPAAYPIPYAQLFPLKAFDNAGKGSLQIDSLEKFGLLSQPGRPPPPLPVSWDTQN